MSTKIEPWGFVVIESCDDYEQILSLDVGKDRPPGGVLTWAGGKDHRVFFASRKAARAAIERTDHYCKAFGLTNMPQRKFCRVELIASVSEPSA